MVVFDIPISRPAAVVDKPFSAESSENREKNIQKLLCYFVQISQKYEYSYHFPWQFPIFVVLYGRSPNFRTAAYVVV